MRVTPDTCAFASLSYNWSSHLIIYTFTLNFDPHIVLYSIISFTDAIVNVATPADCLHTLGNLILTCIHTEMSKNANQFPSDLPAWMCFVSFPQIIYCVLRINTVALWDVTPNWSGESRCYLQSVAIVWVWVPREIRIKIDIFWEPVCKSKNEQKKTTKNLIKKWRPGHPTCRPLLSRCQMSESDENVVQRKKKSSSQKILFEEISHEAFRRICIEFTL